MAEVPEKIWIAKPVEFKSLISKAGPAFDDDVQYIRADVYEAAVREAREDCLLIAQGCFDYGGGYRFDDEKLAIFHHGIQTVVNSLTAFIEKGLADTQVASLYQTGRAAAAKEGEK